MSVAGQVFSKVAEDLVGQEPQIFAEALGDHLLWLSHDRSRLVNRLVTKAIRGTCRYRRAVHKCRAIQATLDQVLCHAQQRHTSTRKLEHYRSVMLVSEPCNECMSCLASTGRLREYLSTKRAELTAYLGEDS